MAIPDDLSQLAQQDVVYLTQTLESAAPTVGSGSITVFRGRLHQALSGNWVFNTATGQNGVIGIVLGVPGNNWSSTETPAAGLQITITNTINQQAALYEVLTLMNVIPADLAD
jgi:hypothetical protein